VAIVGLVGAIALITVVSLWAFTKVLKWRLTAESDDRRATAQWALQQLTQTYTVAVVVLLVVEFGWGIAAWITDVFNFIA